MEKRKSVQIKKLLATTRDGEGKKYEDEEEC